ncbi:MAG TPA: hypothetical protein PLM75_10080 [bacterium]|nr:hypothetical protein [bacterium]HPP88193.1 hypothetical protein [bacterium]
MNKIEKQSICETIINNPNFTNGLYLIFNDGHHIDLTINTIEDYTHFFFDKKLKKSQMLMKHHDTLFEKCSVCIAEKEKFCRAIRPFIAFLEEIDKYKSYERTLALYKNKNDDLIYMIDTDIQHSLRFLSMFSVLKYCSAGQKFAKYFYGLVPLMDGISFCNRLYLNIYWINKGNYEIINSEIEAFKEEMDIMLTNLKEKLDIICNNDAYLNSIVNFHIISLILSMDIESNMAKAIENYTKNFIAEDEDE